MHPAITTTELFLLALGIVFTLPYLIWRLCRLDRYAPLVVVQILSGVALGPGVLGRALPELHTTLFNHDVLQALNGIAAWAVIAFVWIAGVELDLRETWRHRRESGVAAAFALGTPLLLGSAAGAGLLLFEGWIGPQAEPWQFMLGVGMACAVTALPILILLMQQLGILRQPLGQRILRYASLDDVAIWAVLAAILMEWGRLGRQLGFLAAFALAATVLRRLFARLAARDRWYAALIWLIACAWGADWCGLHYMVGAFLAGVAMDAEWFGQDALDALRDHVLLVFMPVFFLSTGLRTQWAMDGSAVFAAVVVLLFAAVAGKLLGMRLAGLVLGWSPAQARLIGWLLQTKALIMIIFANVLLDKGVISSATFTALLLMAVISTALTMPLAAPLLRRWPQLAGADIAQARQGVQPRHLSNPEPQELHP